MSLRNGNERPSILAYFSRNWEKPGVSLFMDGEPDFPLRIQTDRTGIKVRERKKDPTMEKPTAKATGTKRAWATPLMKKAGMKTARTHNMVIKRGMTISLEASNAAWARLFPLARWV